MRKTWRRPPPPPRRRKLIDPPRLIRFSGVQMSDPDFWKERAEAEAAREAAVLQKPGSRNDLVDNINEVERSSGSLILL
jgi:hypothetical protein